LVVDRGGRVADPNWKTKNGKPILIEEPKKAGAAVAALAVGAAVALGGGGAFGVEVGSTVESQAGRVVDRATDKAVDSARGHGRNAKRDKALLKRGVKVLREQFDNQFQCAVHSYGQIRDFFLRTPCTKLHRELVVVIGRDQAMFVVAIAWVHMPSAGDAAQLKGLVDRDGTGNVSAIASSALGLAGVRYTGKYYGSRLDGDIVVIGEAAVVSGHPTFAELDGAAETAASLDEPD
jgi:hypothetical protein